MSDCNFLRAPAARCVARYALSVSVADFLRDRRDDAEEWCEAKAWWPRAALLAYLVYAGVRHLASPMYRSWFAGITLAFHEMGHVLFVPLGRTMTILGGSLMQLIVPTAAAVYLLLRQRDYFGFAVGGAWLATSMFELATYVGDASHEDLPLVGFGGNPEHDWSSLLTQWHLLNHDAAIATCVRVVAFVVWAASMALGAWLCVTMARSGRASRSGG
jgi:hypothetical protein